MHTTKKNKDNILRKWCSTCQITTPKKEVKKRNKIKSALCFWNPSLAI